MKKSSKGKARPPGRPTNSSPSGSERSNPEANPRENGLEAFPGDTESLLATGWAGSALLRVTGGQSSSPWSGPIGWLGPRPRSLGSLRGAGSPAPPAPADGARAEEGPDRDGLADGRAAQGVLVVGMGDEARGDSGIGVHLVRCLAVMDWPAGVTFCQADESVPARAERFARIILVDAANGPEPPGSLYTADPEELLSCSRGGEGSGLGLLTMLPRSTRKRLSIFGVQPANTGFGSPISGAVLASLPILLPYLRAVILRAVNGLRCLN